MTLKTKLQMMNNKKRKNFSARNTAILSLLWLIVFTSCSKDKTTENIEYQGITEIRSAATDPGEEVVSGVVGLRVFEWIIEPGDDGLFSTALDCSYGPGFCNNPAGTSNIFLDFGVEIDESFENGGDAITLMSLDQVNHKLLLRFTEIREGWFDEGGYLDGTFGAPELTLDPELTDLLGADLITLEEGIYEMIEDPVTGDYLVNIDVFVE